MQRSYIIEYETRRGELFYGGTEVEVSGSGNHQEGRQKAHDRWVERRSIAYSGDVPLRVLCVSSTWGGNTFRKVTKKPQPEWTVA